MSDYIYGQLDDYVLNIDYEGLTSDTATVIVDNIERTISVDVKPMTAEELQKLIIGGQNVSTSIVGNKLEISCESEVPKLTLAVDDINEDPADLVTNILTDSGMQKVREFLTTHNLPGVFVLEVDALNVSTTMVKWQTPVGSGELIYLSGIAQFGGECQGFQLNISTVDATKTQLVLNYNYVVRQYSAEDERLVGFQISNLAGMPVTFLNYDILAFKATDEEISMATPSHSLSVGDYGLKVNGEPYQGVDVLREKHLIRTTDWTDEGVNITLPGMYNYKSAKTYPANKSAAVYLNSEITCTGTSLSGTDDLVLTFDCLRRPTVDVEIYIEVIK